MGKPTDESWVVLALIAFLVLFAPAVILAATLEVLFLFGELELSDISVLEFIELYLLDLFLLLLFALGVYWATTYIVEHQLPDTLDDREAEMKASDDETK